MAYTKKQAAAKPGLQRIRDKKKNTGGSKGKKMVAQKPVTKPRPGGPGTVTKPVLPRPPKRGR
jgi:hypothetical protein